MPETETAKKSSCGCSGHSAHASPATDTTNQTGHIDPVCGMTVIPERAAASHLFEGTTYYFCNPGCKTRFAGNEEYYLTGKHKEDAAKAAAEAPADTIYFCPMHPEVQSPTFDSCPKCGMALEPMGGAPSDSDPELEDMTRRFKFALSFTAPLFVISMGSMLLMPFIHQYLDRSDRWRSIVSMPIESMNSIAVLRERMPAILRVPHSIMPDRRSALRVIFSLSI